MTEWELLDLRLVLPEDNHVIFEDCFMVNRYRTLVGDIACS